MTQGIRHGFWVNDLGPPPVAVASDTCPVKELQPSSLSRLEVRGLLGPGSRRASVERVRDERAERAVNGAAGAAAHGAGRRARTVKYV